MEKYITLKEIAQELGMDRVTLYRKLKKAHYEKQNSGLINPEEHQKIIDILKSPPNLSKAP